MKKAISVILALLMALTLFACKTQGTPAPAASSSAPSTAPSASPEASQAPSPSEATDVTASENSVGFFKDGVDPASRKTYNIVWAYPRAMALMQNINNVLVELEPKLNYKTTAYCANNDMDAYLQNIEIYIDQKVDGFMMVFDPTTNMRFKEILDESKIPYIAVMNSVRDENGSEVIPCVGIEGKLAGEKTLQWLYDNYKTYWGDIDTAQIGLLDFTFSPNKDFQDRHDGAMAKFKELLPNNTKIFTVDGVSGKLDEQTGYELASATLTANADVKYWFITACIETYSQGAARAVEALKMEDKVLITNTGSDVLSAEWDTGYNGSWVSCLALSDYQYTIPSICGLIALVDGKATPDSLWTSKRAATDKVTFYNVQNEMVTKDTYKAFFDKVKKDAGLA